MAGSNRGRLKEHLEGVHKNCEWIKTHVADSLLIIGEVNPKLQEGFRGLGELAKSLDEFAQDMYSHI